MKDNRPWLIMLKKTKAMQPFTFYWPKNRSKYVVEADKGTIKKTNTKTSDMMKF